MKFPNRYNILKTNQYESGNIKIVPIRYEDRLLIMRWRNEQMYHLRQQKKLTETDQNQYFDTIVSKLFDAHQPNQLLFSYLQDDVCIGYGGLVHINWKDKNAEISFIIDPKLEKEYFQQHWTTYLSLIEQVAFEGLDLRKIYTYAFDLRPHLYEALEKQGFNKEATLKEHCFFNNKFIDIIIHEKRQPLKNLSLRRVNEKDAKLLFNWANDKEVRKNAINIEPILWENHLVWFNNKLKSNKTKIFILESLNNSIGQVRVDKSYNEDVWVIDFSIDKKYRGKGNGYIILKELIKKEPKMKLKGIVKKENLPSQKAFERLLFHKKEIKDKGLIEYIYGK